MNDRQEATASAPSSFEAVSTKEATREQWQHAAAAWHRWRPVLEDHLLPATELMLDMARIGPGDRVLDVAAGAGGQTLAAARRIGESGSILAIDISSNILELAQHEARKAGLDNVITRVGDGERLDVEEEAFDAVISRLGFIFPDQVGAFRRMRRVLKPDGRLAGIVYSTPENNEFLSIPVEVIRRRARLPAPSPAHPGPFAFGAEGAIEAALEQAGFEGIDVRRLESPLRLSSAAQCVRLARESFGHLQQMQAVLDEAGRDAAWREIEHELRRFEGPDGFVAPGETIVVVATTSTTR